MYRTQARVRISTITPLDACATLHMSTKATMSAGLVDKANTAAHSVSGNKTSRDRNLRFPGNKLSRTLPNPFGATAGKKSTSRPVITHSGRAKKGAAASTQRQQDSSGPEFPPGYNRVIRLHDTTEFPGLGLAPQMTSLSRATANQPHQQAALTDQLQSTASKAHRPVNGLQPSSRSSQATAAKTHRQEISKPSLNIRPPPGLQQIAPTTDKAASQRPPDMSQTASVAGCSAPLPPGLHPAPSFSDDSLQLPGFAQAVTATPEAQLLPELSQASRDSLETQLACLQVCTEANAAAQAYVRSPELPIAPVQAKSAFAQAAAATVWYEPPALTTAHDVTSPDPTVTASNQPGPNTPAVPALASQPSPHQGMNPQQSWEHESPDPILQAQSRSDSSRAAHQEEASCQSHEPWQDAWAIDQSGSCSTAAQTDQLMLSDVPQQDSSSWDYYEIYKQQQLIDQLDYDDSWQDEDSCEDADDDDIIFSHQQLHLYDDSWQDDDRCLQHQHDSSCQHNQGQAPGFDVGQAPYSTYPQSQRQHGSEDDAHELVHDYFPHSVPHSVQTDRSAHYQPQFDHGFKAAQQPGRADSKTKRKGHHGGIPAAMRKAGGSGGQLSATDNLTDGLTDRPTYRPTDRPAKLVAPEQHPSHSRHLQPSHDASAEEHAMHSKLRQLGVQLSGQRPIASQQFQKQHAHYFKNAQPSAAPTASHRSRQCFHSSRNSEHQQGAAGAFSDCHRSSDDQYSERHRFLDRHDQHVGTGAVSCPGASMPQNGRQSASFATNSIGQGKVLTVHRHKASSSMHGLPCTGAVSRPGNKQASSMSQPQITADAGNTQPYISLLVLSQG